MVFTRCENVMWCWERHRGCYSIYFISAHSRLLNPLPLVVNPPALRSFDSHSFFLHSPSFLPYMSLHSIPSERMEKSPVTHVHVAVQDDIDVAAKLAASANTDVPLRPEAVAKLKWASIIVLDVLESRPSQVETWPTLDALNVQYVHFSVVWGSTFDWPHVLPVMYLWVYLVSSSSRSDCGAGWLLPIRRRWLSHRFWGSCRFISLYDPLHAAYHVQGQGRILIKINSTGLVQFSIWAILHSR